MAAQNTPDRDAVIFIPGLGGESDQSLDGLARRMAAEMTRNAPHPSIHFCVADANYREPSGSDDVSAMPEMRSV